MIAHRGGAALGRENSLDVLVEAVNARADVVEIDLQELGDGTVVLAHDSSIGPRWRRHRLRELDLAGYAARLGHRPVQLGDLIERIASLPLGLYLDVKRVTPPGLASIVDTVLASPVAGRVVVGSFNHDVVTAVVADGRLPASVLFHSWEPDPVALAGRFGCSIVHPCFDNDPSMVGRLAVSWIAEAHAAGLDVIGWNSNDASLLAEMAAAGFDAVCTDDPRLVADASWR